MTKPKKGTDAYNEWIETPTYKRMCLHISRSKTGKPRPDMKINNPMHRKEVKEKFIGDKHPSKRPEVRNKISESNKRYWKEHPEKIRHGDKHPSKRPEVAAKISAAKKGKPQPWVQGDKCPFLRPDVYAKTHGINHVMNKPEIKARIIAANTGQKRPSVSGDKSPTKRPEVRAKISASKLGQTYPTACGKNHWMNRKPELKQKWLEKMESMKKYSVNEHYFDNIDSPDKAYFLGLLYADGNNNINKKNRANTISIALYKEEDSHILHSFAEYTKNTRPIHIQYRKGKSNGYWFHISNKYMSQKLLFLGLIPAKSKKITFPEWLDTSLHSHFIRGIFDGDGSIEVRHNKNNLPNGASVSIVGTTALCNSILNIMNQNIGIVGTIYKHRISNNISQYKIMTIQGVIKFCDWIYKDANELKLNRKYKKYLSLLTHPN